MNRSIEGDSSIRVWVAPTELRMHFMSNILECLVNTHLGPSNVERRGHELKSQCSIFDILSVYLLLVAYVLTI